MSKCKKIKAKAYAFGLDDYGTAASIGGSLMQGFAKEGSTFDTIGGTLNGAGTGLATGFTVGGPIGGIIGGAVGLAGGLFGGINRRKQIQEAERRKQAADKRMMAGAITSNMQSEYYDDNPVVTYAMANGGYAPDLAYVDNNELIRDYNGNITEVPNTQPGTDNHLIDASNVESVLSNKLKRPGTNRTFAQEGKRIMNMKNKTKGTDRFAKMSQQLNEYNANQMYEQLLAEQESLKRSRGIKPKLKGIPAYADGKDNKVSQHYKDVEKAMRERALTNNLNRPEDFIYTPEQFHYDAVDFRNKVFSYNNANKRFTKDEFPDNSVIKKIQGESDYEPLYRDYKLTYINDSTYQAKDGKDIFKLDLYTPYKNQQERQPMLAQQHYDEVEALQGVRAIENKDNNDPLSYTELKNKRDVNKDNKSNKYNEFNIAARKDNTEKKMREYARLNKDNNDRLNYEDNGRSALADFSFANTAIQARKINDSNGLRFVYEPDFKNGLEYVDRKNNRIYSLTDNKRHDGRFGQADIGDADAQTLINGLTDSYNEYRRTTEGNRVADLRRRKLFMDLNSDKPADRNTQVYLSKDGGYYEDKDGNVIGLRAPVDEDATYSPGYQFKDFVVTANNPNKKQQTQNNSQNEVNSTNDNVTNTSNATVTTNAQSTPKTTKKATKQVVKKQTPVNIQPLENIPLFDKNDNKYKTLLNTPGVNVSDVNVDLNTVKPVFAPLTEKMQRNLREIRRGIVNGDNKYNSFARSLTGLAPIAYNFARSFQNPEYEETVLNPYAATTTSALARRSMNIEPTLNANRRASAVAAYNTRNLNPNTGVNLAYNTQLAANNYAANADLYAARDNANNQYLGEYANMTNNLGQQYVSSRTLANDLNARNRATARNFASTAVGQLGKWSQVKEQMSNQARRDAQVMPYLQDYLRAVTNINTNNLTV